MRRLSYYWKVFGVQGLVLALLAVSTSRSIRIPYYCTFLRQWITLRTKTSDLAVYEKVVRNQEYATHSVNIDARVIVDLGANVGFSTLYFAKQYPNAIVIAVEPDESNYSRLVAHTKSSDAVFCVKSAIWNENTSVIISGETNSDFRTSSDGKGQSVEAITVDELLKRYSIDYVDVMKIDIEGAEKKIFESPNNWINKVGLIVIELHDRLVPGCSKTVAKATDSFDSSWEHGENTFFLRESLIT